jgi:hypothetical protein
MQTISQKICYSGSPEEQNIETLKGFAAQLIAQFEDQQLAYDTEKLRRVALYLA